MKNIAEFIAQAKEHNYNYKVWIYAQNGCYKELPLSTTKHNSKALTKILDQHLQIIIELIECDIPRNYLLLPEINAVTHISFDNNKITSLAA